MELKPKPLQKMNMKFFRNMALIFERLFFGFMILFLLASLVGLVLPEHIFELNFQDISEYKVELGGKYKVYLNTTDVDFINFKWIATVIGFSASIVLLIIFLLIRQIRTIFDTLVEKNPFHEKNASRIMFIGILLIVASVIFNLAEYISVNILLDQIKNQTVVLNFSINTGMLFSGIIIMILSSVFRYGTFLQNEYDSTL